MVRKFLLVLSVYLATSTLSLMALGLGEIKLKSGLNQPLDAEITLLSVRGESNEQLRGSLGSNDDFDRAGIERLFFLSKIRFETITKKNGAKALHLTTNEAVKEPFLNFLINLEWPNGRLLREYTLLLDPPIFEDSPDIVVTPAAAPSPAQPKPVAERTIAPKQQWQGDIYGPTSSNDTLWSIAAKVRPDNSISMQQAMATIFEANPDAFMRGNINNLKKGAEIKVPDAETFEQISQREALRMIAIHNENWKSGKRTPPAVVIDTSQNNSNGNSATSNTADSGRLSLSTDDSELGVGGSTVANILTEEENEILKQENEILQVKTQSDAEKIEQLERLLELKNEQLTALQNNNDEDRETITEATPTVENVNETTPLMDSAAKEVKVVDAESTPNQPANTSIIDDLMSGVYNLHLGVAGAIIFLLLLLSVNRRKNQKVRNDEITTDSKTDTLSKIKVEDSIDKLPNIADNVLAGTSFADFDEPAIEVKNAADPIGEADIYIAYGKFEQAESLLLNTLEDNAKDLDLNTKLLECYAEMDNQDKFEARVEMLLSEIDSDEDLRVFVEELYQTSWPEGALFTDLSDTDDENDDDDNGDDGLVIEDEMTDDELSDNLEELPSSEEVFGDLQSIDDEDELDFEVIDEDSLEEDEFEFDTQDDDNYDEDDDDINDDDVDEDDVDEDDDIDDDIATQLELARAYVEMGDIEGTREIISEIMETGTEEQCEEAQSILDSIEK